jgi:hypothetical protein
VFLHPSKPFLRIASAIAAIVRLLSLSGILVSQILAKLHSSIAKHFNRSVFLRPSQQLANLVSMDARIFRHSHSKPGPGFRKSVTLHFLTVRHVCQFVFRPAFVSFLVWHLRILKSGMSLSKREIDI